MQNVNELMIDVAGRSIRARDMGTGEAVIVISDREKTLPAGLVLLAESYRVLVVDAGDAAVLPEFAASLGLKNYSLVGHGPVAPATLDAALAAPGPVDAVVISAPTGVDRLDCYDALDKPVLALFGTRDETSPPDGAARYREHLTDCHVMMIYDAGHDIYADRPEAVAEVAGDFLRRRDRFLVTEDSGLIHP